MVELMLAESNQVTGLPHMATHDEQVEADDTYSVGCKKCDKVSVGNIMFACPFGEYMLCVQTRRDVYNLKARVNAYIQNPEPTATTYWITFGISFTTPR
jgi:hypothetical protein